MSDTIQDRLSNLTPFNSEDQDVFDAAIAEIDSLEAQLAAKSAECEALREDACNKVLAMTDEQVRAMAMLDHRSPDDIKRIMDQSIEIAALKHERDAALLAHAMMVESCIKHLDGKAFLCHAHDDYGKGKEAGILYSMEELCSLAPANWLDKAREAISNAPVHRREASGAATS